MADYFFIDNGKFGSDIVGNRSAGCRKCIIRNPGGVHIFIIGMLNGKRKLHILSTLTKHFPHCPYFLY